MRKVLKVVGLVVAIAVMCVIGLLAYGVGAWDRVVVSDVRHLNAPNDAASIARGEFLYRDALACWSCHSDPAEPNPGSPPSGGREFNMMEVGPGFGMAWATNLTSDDETGLGAWSDGELARTIREGVDREGRLLFPIMESQMYQGLSDDDVLALIAYLRTIPPVKNATKPYAPTLAAKLLFTFMFKPMKHSTEPVQGPPPGETVEYGRYLAWHVGMCVGCHTPRSPDDGQWDMTQPFAGGVFTIEEPTFGWTGSNLTPAEAGLGAWSEGQFLSLMREGTRPDGRVVIPAVMPWPSYAHWSDRDLKAVWKYLRTVAPIEHEVSPTRLARDAVAASGALRGRALFATYCVSCHGRDGAGTPYTDAVMKEVATEQDDEDLAIAIQDGSETMPGFAETLDEGQRKDAIAYIRTFAPYAGPPAAAAPMEGGEGDASGEK